MFIDYEYRFYLNRNPYYLLFSTTPADAEGGFMS